MKKKTSGGLTLIELLVVMAIVAILITMGWMAWHNQINKARDAQRKDHLSRLKISFEDFYNDKKCYPKPDEVCYQDKTLTICPICGNDINSPDFKPYLSRLPCDPSQPLKKYLYQVDSIGCPKWYRVYAVLANTSDPVIAEVGCSAGCGPSPDFIYNYGVSSPNIGLETNNNLCSLTAPLYANPFCNNCGTYSQCKITYPGEIYYIDHGGGGVPGCTTACIKD